MAGAKYWMATCTVLLCGFFAPTYAAPFANGGYEAKSQAMKIDYRRCWIEDGEEVCRHVIEEDYDQGEDYDVDDDYAYGAGPSVLLGFGNGHAFHHGHGGHEGHGGHGGHSVHH